MGHEMGLATMPRKIWITKEDLQDLSTSFGNHAEQFPHDSTVMSIHNEIAVSKQRYETSMSNFAEFAKAIGKNPSDVPLILTISEAAYLCSISNLPRELRVSILRSLL